jgi:hypothetical protein
MLPVTKLFQRKREKKNCLFMVLYVHPWSPPLKPNSPLDLPFSFSFPNSTQNWIREPAATASSFSCSTAAPPLLHVLKQLLTSAIKESSSGMVRDLGLGVYSSPRVRLSGLNRLRPIDSFGVTFRSPNLLDLDFDPDPWFGLTTLVPGTWFDPCFRLLWS